MNLLNVSSVDMLQGYIDNVNVILGGTESDLATLMGVGVGSIAKAGVDQNAYADTKVANVDLTQVALNTTAITTLVGTTAIPGSIKVQGGVQATATLASVDATIVPIETAVQTLESAVAVLNGDATVIGSVAKTISDVVSAAPANLDTFGEIAAELSTISSAQVTTASTIATNKAVNDTAILNNTTKVNGFFDSNELMSATTAAKDGADIIAEFDAEINASPNRMRSINNLSEAHMHPQFVRTNLELISNVDLEAYVALNATEYISADIVVAGGKIVLDPKVNKSAVQEFRIKYVSSGITSYDEVAIVENVTVPGEFIVNDRVAGDLDGTTLSVVYAIIKV